MLDLPEACYRVCVKGVFQNEEGSYLLSRKGDFRRFPGGGIDHGETFAQALKREMIEECSLDVSVGTPEYFLTYEKDGRHVANVLVRMYINDTSTSQTTEESLELKFFTVQELKEGRENIVHWLQDWIDLI